MARNWQDVKAEAVERGLLKHSLTKDCWCNPTVEIVEGD